MEIKAGEFTQILSLLKPGVSERNIIKEMSHYLFTKDQISSFNGKIFLSHPFESGFRCSIDADKLFDFVSSVQSSNVLDISIEDNQFRIKTKKAKAGFSVVQENKLFDIVDSLSKEYENLEWKVLPNDFVQGLRLCMFSTLRDATRGVLSGVHVNNKDIISCDDFRVSNYKMESDINIKITIPLSSIQELVDLNMEKFSESDSWLHFSTKDNIRFSTQQIVGEYPDVLTHLTIDEKLQESIHLPTSTHKIIENLVSLSEGEGVLEKILWISLSENNITFKAERKGLSWVERNEDMDYHGKDINFSINPVFLLQILEKSDIINLYNSVATFNTESFHHLMNLPVQRYSN